ncbi:hypothetical protein N9501_08300 [Amylibacter sp.]|nr:hypothetical protein [Amylibacter sp.]
MKPRGTEIIIGNSKTIEFRVFCVIASLLPKLKFCYINDFFLDDLEDLKKVSKTAIFTKIYIIEKSDEDVTAISEALKTEVIAIPNNEQKVREITNCKVLSVKPIMQFPVRYYGKIMRFIFNLVKNNNINVVTFHPRVGIIERKLYRLLFSNAVEVEASEVNFLNVEFFGFYSNIILKALSINVVLINFINHRPYEEFKKKLNLK